MNDIYFVVATSGHGLTVRQVSIADLTFYTDFVVATFDTLAEASAFAEANDSSYYDDESFLRG